MRNAAMTIAAVAMAMGAGTVPAHGRMRAPARRIDACLADDPKNEIIGPAKTTASQIYSLIGVDLRWHANHCPPDGIRITLQSGTPRTERPGALAYSLLSEGPHIVVFYDRVTAAANGERTVAALCGHVLAHEIGHTLEGFPRHSETGTMKARWTAGDLALMEGAPLKFADEDIELIYRGIEKRTATLTASRQP